MKKDKIYKRRLKKIPPFEFNKEVAVIFDDMVIRSVPFYKAQQKLLAKLALHFYKPDKIIYDLGCATGETLREIARNKTIEGIIKMTGMDLSPHMLKIARQKCSHFPEIIFKKENILQADIINPAVVILTYVLQFLKTEKRKFLLKKIFNNLENGGAVLISEKICCNRLNKDFIRLHDLFKIEKGYSELEVKQKRKALEEVLTPLTYEENKTMLHDCGFKIVEPFFQYLSFCGFIGIKS